MLPQKTGKNSGQYQNSNYLKALESEQKQEDFGEIQNTEGGMSMEEVSCS